MRFYELSELNIKESLGRGTYGQVFSATLSDGSPVIVKQFREYEDQGTCPGTDYYTEIMLYNLLNRKPSTKTVKLHGLYYGPSPSSSSGTNKLFMVLERYGESDLKGYRTNLHANFPYKTSTKELSARIKDIFRKSLEGLAEIHKMGVVHNDLKLQNMLYDSVTDDIRIIDFGLATFLGLGPAPHATNEFLKANYLDVPEIYLHPGRVSYCRDVYNLARTIIDLSVEGGTNIINLSNNQRIIQNFDKFQNPTGLISGHDMTDDVLSIFGKDGLDLLIKMLDTNATTRITAKDALNHQYFGTIKRGGKYSNEVTMYTPEQIEYETLELAYAEDIHNNYKNDLAYLFPTNLPELKTEISNLMIEMSNSDNTSISLDVYVNTMIMMMSRLSPVFVAQHLLKTSKTFVPIDITRKRQRDDDTDDTEILNKLFVSIVLFNSITSIYGVYDIKFPSKFNLDSYPRCVNLSFNYELDNKKVIKELKYSRINFGFYPVVTHIMYVMTRKSFLNHPLIINNYTNLHDSQKKDKILQIMNVIIDIYSKSRYMGQDLTIWQIVQYAILKVFNILPGQIAVFDIDDVLFNALTESLPPESASQTLPPQTPRRRSERLLRKKSES